MRVLEKTAGTSPSQKFSRANRPPKLPVMAALALLPIAAFLASLALGRFGIPLPQLVKIIIYKILGLAQTWPDTLDKVLFNVRIPRILCGLMVGAALSTSGAAYQGVFKNPMVSPDILGHLRAPDSARPLPFSTILAAWAFN